MIGACIVIGILLYRKFARRSASEPTHPKEIKQQETYAVPEPSSRTMQPPPQFTTKFIGGGCSSGGGVTDP